MFGFRYSKFDPTQFIIRYTGGRVAHKGAGLAFWYFRPSTSLVSIPLGSIDAPFIFEEITADFQEVTVQGQVTYRISEPEKIARLLNYTLDGNARAYVSQDPEKLQQRVINVVKVLTRGRIQQMKLREALRTGSQLSAEVTGDLSGHPEMVSLGLEVLSLSILAVKPNPETARALEAEAREQLLKEADDAIYSRRNAAVEQERSIKENELRTEQAVQEKQHQLAASQTNHEISIEERRRELVQLAAENSRAEADARAYGLGAVIKALADSDPKIVQALAGISMQPDHLIAAAVHELAVNAEKIGELNLAPELLQDLLRSGRRPVPQSK